MANLAHLLARASNIIVFILCLFLILYINSILYDLYNIIVVSKKKVGQRNINVYVNHPF